MSNSVIELCLATLEKKLEDQEKRLQKYDLLAARWAGICISAIVIGAMLTAGVDKTLKALFGMVKP